jgi:hypothetical protein
VADPDLLPFAPLFMPSSLSLRTESNGEVFGMTIQRGRQYVGISTYGQKMGQLYEFISNYVRSPELLQGKSQKKLLQSLIASQPGQPRKQASKVLTFSKKTKGRKRPIAVDTMGLLVEVLIHSAGILDRVGGSFRCSKARDQWSNVYQKLC